MIGLDTNVMLRYLMQDYVAQSALASQLMNSLTEASPGYLPLICVAELYWVLDHTYKLSKSQIVDALRAITASATVLVQDRELVEIAVYAYLKGNADFDDYLITRCAKAAGCVETLTFDKLAAESGGMTLLT